MGLTDLSCHDGKVTPDTKMFCISHEKYKDGNRDYCNHSSMIFETTSKLLIVFVRFILGKLGVEQFMGPRCPIDIIYEFDLKVILKGIGCKKRLLLLFLI